MELPAPLLTAATGDSFMAQADKKLKSFGFFGNKYEEAAELLEKAANNYKLGKVRALRRAARRRDAAAACRACDPRSAMPGRSAEVAG